MDTHMKEITESFARAAGGHFEASEEPASCADEWIFTPTELAALVQAVARHCMDIAKENVEEYCVVVDGPPMKGVEKAEYSAMANGAWCVRVAIASEFNLDARTGAAGTGEAGG